MILHTVNKSVGQSSVLEDCLELLLSEDALLLIEDGVLAALDTELNRELLAAISTPLFVLSEDVEARHLGDRLMPRVQVISYTGFIDLCVRYNKVVNWT